MIVILSGGNLKLINVLTFLQEQNKFSIDFRRMPRVSEQQWSYQYKFERTRPLEIWRSQTQGPSHVWGCGIQPLSSEHAHPMRAVCRFISGLGGCVKHRLSMPCSLKQPFYLPTTNNNLADILLPFCNLFSCRKLFFIDVLAWFHLYNDFEWGHGVFFWPQTPCPRNTKWQTSLWRH